MSETGKFKIKLSEQTADPECPTVEIYFNEKPDKKVREMLKGRHFRWAPSKGAWWGPAMTLVGTPFEGQAKRYLTPKRAAKKAPEPKQEENK